MLFKFVAGNKLLNSLKVGNNLIKSQKNIYNKLYR